MSNSDVRQSKFLSLILRHDPGRIGLRLDPEGWARIDDIVAKSDIGLTRARIAEIVHSNTKQRFALSPDGLSIRANQGHSVSIDLGLTAATPPQLLFHGTARKSVNSIRQSGLNKQNRQHVHLSLDIETAKMVGARHGSPVVYSVRAGAMNGDGFLFYLSKNGVWLTDTVPPIYLAELEE